MNTETNKLWKALLEVQKELVPVLKDSTAKAGSFQYKYADINQYIEVVKPILAKHGIVLLQPLCYHQETGTQHITTVIVHAESGEKIEHSTLLPPINPDPQKQGSVYTYYRRYALQSILFLQAEDDDGNAASAPARKTDVKRVHTLTPYESAQKAIDETMTVEALETVLAQIMASKKLDEDDKTALLAHGENHRPNVA